MPYLHKVSKMHECSSRPHANVAGKKYLTGTKWQCPICKKIYKLDNDQRDGWIWMETKEVIRND